MTVNPAPNEAEYLDPPEVRPNDRIRVSVATILCADLWPGEGVS
jgi:hypothetical protein